jgi:hypothetical protein
MTDETYYILETDEEDRTITIRPVNQVIPGGDLYATGVYNLFEGAVGLGSITFEDPEFVNWRYDGWGELSDEEAAELANFISNYED